MSEKPMVAVVDDDKAMRGALERLFRTQGLASKAFANPEELLSSLPSLTLDCIVLDLRMPELNGLELQRKLREQGVMTPIIFLTGHADVPSSVKAMKNGALDFLAKPFQEDDLLAAIRDAVQRSSEARARQANLQAIQSRLESLTPREREVMLLVVQGRMNKEIAADLGASIATVKIHRGRVMRKMEVHSLAELVQAAESLGLL